MTEKGLDISKSKIFSRIKFIDHELINIRSWGEAKNKVSNIDPDNVSFATLALDLPNSYSCTGDKKLRTGLRKKGFKQVINTQELVKFIEKSNEE